MNFPPPGQLGPVEIDATHSPHMNVSDPSPMTIKRSVRISDTGEAYLRVDQNTFMSARQLRDLADALETHSVGGVLSR